HLRSLR
ncbi:flavin oxidoreductase / NADH oxidase family protein, partial [Vibrio parahaemolyticus V-223/04]